MSYMNEQWVMSYKNEQWVMSYMNEQWVMSYMNVNESCHIWMSTWRILNLMNQWLLKWVCDLNWAQVRCQKYIWNKKIQWMSHVTYAWAQSLTYTVSHIMLHMSELTCYIWVSSLICNMTHSLNFWRKRVSHRCFKALTHYSLIYDITHCSFIYDMTHCSFIYDMTH